MPAVAVIGDERCRMSLFGSAKKLVHVLFAKCPERLGLMQINYMKLFYSDPLKGEDAVSRLIRKSESLPLMHIPKDSSLGHVSFE